MTITADTIFYAVLILFVLTATHTVAYLNGWERGYHKGMDAICIACRDINKKVEVDSKEVKIFLSTDEINKAVDEIIKEREE